MGAKGHREGLHQPAKTRARIWLARWRRFEAQLSTEDTGELPGDGQFQLGEDETTRTRARDERVEHARALVRRWGDRLIVGRYLQRLPVAAQFDEDAGAAG